MRRFYFEGSVRISEVKSKRALQKRAFTLVELLIVVIILGILAGMMMLSAESAVCSAKAARIISDLRTMKAAALLYKADNGSWPVWRYADNAYVEQYGGPTPDKYSDLKIMGDGYWVGAADDDSNGALAFVSLFYVRDGVKKCIEKQAEKSGLYGADVSGPPGKLTLEKFNSNHNTLFSVISR